MLERCHIPNFGGRVKPILVIRIRKHKGCTEEWRGGGELPKKTQAANTQRNSEKKVTVNCWCYCNQRKSCCMHCSCRQCWGQGWASSASAVWGSLSGSTGPSFVFMITGVRISPFMLCWTEPGAHLQCLMVTDRQHFTADFAFWTGACNTVPSPVPTQDACEG